MTPALTTRRQALRFVSFATVGGALAASALPSLVTAQDQPAIQDIDPVLEELGEQIQQLMRDYAVPGVAVGVRVDGQDHSAGFGVLEVIGARPYRELVTDLILRPLKLARSSYFVEDIVDYVVAAGHIPGPDGLRVERPVGSGIFSPATAPAGGLFSTADELLQWAAFHLGDGRSRSGEHIVASETLASMQQSGGPGGAMEGDDLDGVGVNWLLRTLRGVRIVEHGGTWHPA